MRTRVMNQLHLVGGERGAAPQESAVASQRVVQELEGLSLAPWANRRRQDLLDQPIRPASAEDPFRRRVFRGSDSAR